MKCFLMGHLYFNVGRSKCAITDARENFRFVNTLDCFPNETLAELALLSDLHNSINIGDVLTSSVDRAHCSLTITHGVFSL